jgi:hypothetical protein
MTLLLYNYFRTKVGQLTERMEMQGTRLTLFLSQRGASAGDSPM